jgi:hypothetical protein
MNDYLGGWLYRGICAFAELAVFVRPALGAVVYVPNMIALL